MCFIINIFIFYSLMVFSFLNLKDLGNLSELDEEDFDWDDELSPTSEQELMLQPGKPNPEDQLERSRLEEYWNSRRLSRR